MAAVRAASSVVPEAAPGPGALGWRLPPDRAGDPSLLERLIGSVTCSLASCGWYAFPAGWALPERALDYHVAYLCLAGGLAIGPAGDPAPTVIGPGEVLLTGPGERHALSNPSSGSLELLTVHFTARIHDVVDMPVVYGLPRRMRPAPERMARMEGVVRTIIADLDAREPGCGLAANAGCARFVALLWQETVEQGGAPAPAASVLARDLVRLTPVFRLIRERYAERPSVAELAEVVHLEPDYFATIFKRVTGTPPHQYVTAYRLGRVRAMLATTDEPVGRIAARAGFDDSFYLSRAFRRAYGMTPTAYRKSRDSPELP